MKVKVKEQYQQLSLVLSERENQPDIDQSPQKIISQKQRKHRLGIPCYFDEIIDKKLKCIMVEETETTNTNRESSIYTGDLIELYEVHNGSETGREITVEVTHILDLCAYLWLYSGDHVRSPLIVMSIRPIKK